MNKELFIGASSFDDHELKQEKSFKPQKNGCFEFESAVWKYELEQTAKSPAVTDYNCKFKLKRSDALQARLFAQFLFSAYDKNSFVFMPSAAYDGNRFKMVKVDTYPPLFFQHVDADADCMHQQITVQELPALNNGFNRMVTDASTPLVAFFSAKKQKAFFLFCEQGTVLGNNAVEIQQGMDNSLRITLSFPSVRRKVFQKCKNLDRAPDIAEGTEISAAFQTHEIDCRDIACFYHYFFENRKCFIPEPAYKNTMPFSRAKELIVGAFNDGRWREEYGFYSKSIPQSRLHIGWTCFMELGALISDGSASDRERALRHLDLVLSEGQLASGFLYGCATVRDDKLLWHPGFFDVGYDNYQEFTRLNADALHILMKLLLLLDKLNISYPESWSDAVLRLARAFEKTWNNYAQFGFLIDLMTGEILIGESTSGSCAPGGLMLAGEYFSRPEFIKIAKASAEQYYKRDLCGRGFTYGGPGDALLVPDSESAYGLLESLIIIFEHTGDSVWLKRAEHCADYCASWTPSCKYRFPAKSTFDKLDIDCRGAVQANLQNQHGAPGLCTLSGDSLLKLYRASGNRKYLEMLREIAHNITQYVGSPERPIKIKRSDEFLSIGDMCEKVFFQDYGKSCGEIPFGSGGWPEIACLLSCVENPGIYYRLDTGYLIVMDHVEARVVDETMYIENVFDREIAVKILVDDAESIKKPLGESAHTKFLRVKLAAREQKQINLREF